MRRPRIGFTFNLRREIPDADGVRDEEAEFDSPRTIDAIHAAIAQLGYEVVDLEATSELPAKLAAASVDVVFNIAEGHRGRNREALVPALCELLGVEYTGSDPATLSICLDKDLARRLVASHGIATPSQAVLREAGAPLPEDLRFPLVVKPIAEGTSKGITRRSVVNDARELHAVAGELIAKYRQPVVVEGYVSGRELTVGLLGETGSPRVLPAKETVFLDATDPTPIYSFDLKQDWNDRVRHDAPAILDAAEAQQLADVARRTYAALGCRDVARIDYRWPAGGVPVFIECNPLPGMSPGWSDLALIGKAAGLGYEEMIGEILAPAVRRWTLRVE